MSRAAPVELRRLLGPFTTFLLGLGVAIGSGIFRTPGSVAAALGSPVWVLGAWAFGGLFVIASSLVSAELATRFPKAGGEYVYLKEAYGPFVAFFFGWGYTIFIVGGGAATIGAACGEAFAELFGLSPERAPLLGTAAVVVVVAVNALGLKTGAGFQNALTLAKLAALVAVVVAALLVADHSQAFFTPLAIPSGSSLPAAFVAAVVPVLWAYEGSTDAVKMAEEVHDARRDLPRALLGAALALIALYLVVNWAYLIVLPIGTLAATTFAASDVLAKLFGPAGRLAFSLLAALVFLGSLSSTLLTTVRVTFALARDRLAPVSLAHMSQQQAPVPALLLVGSIAAAFTLFRGFAQIMDIYFVAAAVLFGLAYGSLLVFRHRDRRVGPPSHSVFLCPGGPVLAIGLIAVQVGMAVMLIVESPKDGLTTLGLLALCGVCYLPWRATTSSRPGT